MKFKFIIAIFTILASHSFSKILLTPAEILNSPDKYDQKFLGMIGTVRYLETFINGNGERAMKFNWSDDNGNYVTVRLAREEPWLSEGEKVNASGIFYKSFGLGMENYLLIVDQGHYRENILPYEEDNATKLIDGLLRKLIK